MQRSPRLLTPPKSPPTHLDNLKAICINWSLRLNALHTAIPPALHPSVDPVAWPAALTAALRHLSELTPGQMDRAHSLLETYFRARIRCNLYRAQNRGIYARLEVVDVQDAIRSLQLMNRGQAVEGGSRRHSSAGLNRPLGGESARPGSAKRKFTIRDESYKVARRTSSSSASSASSDFSSASTRPRLASISSSFPLSHRATSQPIRTPYFSGLPSRRITSVPNLSLKNPSPKSRLPIPTPTPCKTARSPIWNLLNFPLSPAVPDASETPAKLPPVSALISEIGGGDGADEEKLPSEVDVPDAKKSREMEVRQLELEEAQAALEVARQKHVIATSRAALARSEMWREELLPVRPKSAEK